MSIYSTNRANTVGVTEANVGCYSAMDIGRIMYESECNDMAIFEAILATDFREIQGLREGTLLESEVQSLNEASVKAMLERMQERVKQLWAKIKKAFDSAITWISAYIARNGKAYVKNFRQVYKAQTKNGKKWEGNVEVALMNEKYKEVTKIPTTDAVAADIKAKMRGEKVDKKDIINKHLGALVGDEVSSTGDYMTKVLDICFDKKTAKVSDIETLCGIVENGSSAMKDLNHSKKMAQNAVAQLGKKLKAAEREAEDPSKDVIKNITLLVAAYENIIAATSKAAIKAVQKNVKNSRVALSKIMSDLKKDSKEVLLNSAIVAADEVDEALNKLPGEEIELDPETIETVAQILDDADVDDVAGINED